MKEERNEGEILFRFWVWFLKDGFCFVVLVFFFDLRIFDVFYFEVVLYFFFRFCVVFIRFFDECFFRKYLERFSFFGCIDLC